MCDDKYGSPLKPPISTFELNTDGLSLNEQIKLMDLSESNDFVHAKTMRQQVILVSKVLFDDNSRINYSTIAKIFKSNVNSVLSHNSYKFNALFKKSTTFCICFQLELHFLLAHKKLLTFSIRSQLLLLFLRYIKK